MRFIIDVEKQFEERFENILNELRPILQLYITKEKIIQETLQHRIKIFNILTYDEVLYLAFSFREKIPEIFMCRNVKITKHFDQVFLEYATFSTNYTDSVKEEIENIEFCSDYIKIYPMKKDAGQYWILKGNIQFTGFLKEIYNLFRIYRRKSYD